MALHQKDQADFKSVLPEDVDWKPFAGFPRRHVWRSSWVSPPNRGPT